MLTTTQNQSQTELNKELFTAIYNRKGEKIEDLLKHGADINAKNKQGNTPLHVAINQRSSIAVIKMLLKHKAKVNALNNEDRTPLHVATLYMRIATIKELLSNEADVNAQDCGGMTPLALHINTCAEKQTDPLPSIVSLLILSNANVDDKIKENSVVKGCIEKFERIKKDYPNCAANKNLEAINQKLNLNYKLFTAIYKNKGKKIKNLLKQGANVNAINKQGSTPLHVAILHKCTTIVKELLSNGADINALNQQGETPLELYINTHPLNSPGIIYLLLAFGANVSDKVKANYNPVQKNYIAKFERIKKDYPNCAQLMQVNKDSEAISQYNENTEELDKELEKIEGFYDNFTFNILQNLRQYVLQKSNKIKSISIPKDNATMDLTNEEASDFKKPSTLQNLSQHVLQGSTIKLNSSDVTTSAVEINLKRSTTFEDQNLPFKKRKFGNSLNTQPSGILMTPNIPNKVTNIQK